MIADENGIRHDLMEKATLELRAAVNMEILTKIKILASQFPNDQEFGERVRQLIGG